MGVTGLHPNVVWNISWFTPQLVDCLHTDPVNWNGFNQRLDCVTFALCLHTSQASRYEVLHLQKSIRYTPQLNAPFNIVKYFAPIYTIW